MIIVTGATGFIGRHLIFALSEFGRVPIRALTRQEHPYNIDTAVEFIQGDIADRQALNNLMEPGATLINLAFSNSTAVKDAIAITNNLVEACAENGIKRLIHCSSISVYGRVSGVVTEHTPCAPHDEYGRIKLAVERTLKDQTQGRFELIILRPSEVFGVGGRALISLKDSLLMRNQIVNYARSSLFGRRQTHLVPVETVVEAIRFFCEDKEQYKAETFIVSADDAPMNNFRDIEQVLIEELNLPHYSLPPLTLPRCILENIMRMAGRATTDSQVIYSSQKLSEWGFHTNRNLEDALRTFAKTFNNTKISEKLD